MSESNRPYRSWPVEHLRDALLRGSEEAQIEALAKELAAREGQAAELALLEALGRTQLKRATNAALASSPRRARITQYLIQRAESDLDFWEQSRRARDRIEKEKDEDSEEEADSIDRAECEAEKSQMIEGLRDSITALGALAAKEAIGPVLRVADVDWEGGTLDCVEPFSSRGIDILALEKAVAEALQALAPEMSTSVRAKAERVLVRMLHRCRERAAYSPDWDPHGSEEEFLAEAMAVIIRALAEVGEDSAVPALREAVSFPHWLVRQAALEVLGRCSPEERPEESRETLKVVISALEDEDVDVQAAAIGVLPLVCSTCESVEAAEALESLFESDDRVIRERAALALGRVGGARTLPLLVEAAMASSPRLEAVGASIEIAGRVAKSLLSHPDSSVRNLAFIAALVELVRSNEALSDFVEKTGNAKQAEELRRYRESMRKRWTDPTPSSSTTESGA